MSVETLGQKLLEAGILDAMSVEMRVPRARTAHALLENLIRDGIVTENTLISQLARALSVPRYDPRERQPEPEALALLDKRTCEELGLLPVALRGGGALLWIATCNPVDEALFDEVQRRTGRRVKPCLIGPRELTRALQQLQQGGPVPPSAQPQRPGMPPSYGAPQQVPAQHGAPHLAGPAPHPMMQQGAPYRLPLPTNVSMPGVPPMPGMSYGPVPGVLPNGMGHPGGVPMPGQGYAPAGYGYPTVPPPMPQQGPQQHPTAPPQAPVRDRGPEIAKLEEELAQAKQVVKILAQMLVERGLIDGEDLKRRLRAERDRK